MDFASYWQYTDIVTRFLFFTLIALSIISWVTGLLRLIRSHKMKSQVADDLRQAVNAQSASLEALSSTERKTATEQTLLQQIGRYRYNSEKGLPVLGTTAAIAPFIGLFGTVWGIFHALHSIGETGQAGLGQVAGPVGEALIMTGLGLAVAIPAVVFYNIAVRLNRRTLFIANDTAYGILGDVAKTSPSVTEPNSRVQDISAVTTQNQPNNSSSHLSSSTAN